MFPIPVEGDELVPLGAAGHRDVSALAPTRRSETDVRGRVTN
jgi:hypothetical protein